MAKSKLVKLNQKIEEQVVGGYKKIEKSSVSGFQKIADRFVDAYLTKDGESIEDAKVRLTQEKSQEKSQHNEHRKKH